MRFYTDWNNFYDENCLFDAKFFEFEVKMRHLFFAQHTVSTGLNSSIRTSIKIDITFSAFFVSASLFSIFC